MKFEPVVFFMLMIVCAGSLFAQRSAPLMIDAFGNTNCDNYRARFDTSLAELIKHPGSRGYVLVYEGDMEEPDAHGEIPADKGSVFVPSEAGFGKDVIEYLKNHLLFRNFPTNRITFRIGGYRERFVVEVWLVPIGVAPPKPTPTKTKINQRKRAKKPFGFCGEM